jgi:hypothetical protein
MRDLLKTKIILPSKQGFFLPLIFMPKNPARFYIHFFLESRVISSLATSLLFPTIAQYKGDKGLTSVIMAFTHV